MLICQYKRWGKQIAGYIDGGIEFCLHVQPVFGKIKTDNHTGGNLCV